MLFAYLGFDWQILAECFFLIFLAESDNQKALNRAEISFREFINLTLTEEDPDDIEDKIHEYVNAKGNTCIC